MDIQINSTATNLWSTLVAASVGFALAQLAAFAKARFDRDQILKRTARALATEIAANATLLQSSLKILARDTEATGKEVTAAVSQLRSTTLEAACLQGVFDKEKGPLADKARDLLASIHLVNSHIEAREMFRATSRGLSNYEDVRKSHNGIVTKSLTLLVPALAAVQDGVGSLWMGKKDRAAWKAKYDRTISEQK